MDVKNTDSPPKCRLVTVGATVRALVSGEHGLGNYAKIAYDYPTLDAWLEDRSAGDVDLVIAACPSLFDETVDRVIARLEGSGVRAVLVYDFAKAETEARLADGIREITCLRAPVTAAELREACEADIALATMSDRWAEGEADEREREPFTEIPARQFSEEQLARISQISTAIDCECPHHLAALLLSLNAFEEYSLRCENRNDQDAILHAYLHRSTAKARSMMEEALVVLAEAEGFDID